jgi:hypothetical protein
MFVPNGSSNPNDRVGPRAVLVYASNGIGMASYISVNLAARIVSRRGTFIPLVKKSSGKPESRRVLVLRGVSSRSFTPAGTCTLIEEGHNPPMLKAPLRGFSKPSLPVDPLYMRRRSTEWVSRFGRVWTCPRVPRGFLRKCTGRMRRGGTSKLLLAVPGTSTPYRLSRSSRREV